MKATKYAQALIALGVVLSTGTTQVNAQDQPEPQIQIDARIVVANRDVAGKFDVDWSFLPPGSEGKGLSVGYLNGSPNLDETFSTLERAGQGRLLAKPRLVLPNNGEGEIDGLHLPTQTVANNTVTVTWKDAALNLKVRPSLTTDNLVTMRVALTTPVMRGSFSPGRTGTMVIGGIALDPQLGAREVLVFLTPRIVE